MHNASLEEEVKTRLGHPEPEGLVRFGAPEYFDPGTLASLLLAQFNSRYPAIDLEIQMGIGTDVMRRSEGDPVLALMKRAPSDDRC